MGICSCTKQRRLVDMLVSFTLLMLLTYEAAAAAGLGGMTSTGRTSKLQRRIDVQLQTSDNKYMSSSSYLHHLEAAEKTTDPGRIHSHDHTIQPSIAKIPQRMGTEISTHSLTKASGEKHRISREVNSLQMQSKDVGVLPVLQHPGHMKTEATSSHFGKLGEWRPASDSETLVHMVDLQKQRVQPAHTKRMDLESTASRSASLETMQMSLNYRVHSQAAESGMCMYIVTTETGKKWGAGTDATISLRLMNKDNDEVYFPILDNGKNNFEKGHIDTFQVFGACVESICKMVLSTDDAGFFADWYVETLGFSVTTPIGGRQEKLWELHQWLPKDDVTASLFVMKDDCARNSSPVQPPAA